MRVKLGQAGFSFIELLVTISLMGLILGLVLVNFGSFNKAKMLSAATDQFLVDLRLAASQAMSADKPADCKLADAAFEGYEVAITSDSVYQISALCNGLPSISVTKELVNGVTFTSSGPVTTFYPLDEGADSGSVTLELDTLTQTVQIDSSGAVYVQE